MEFLIFQERLGWFVALFAASKTYVLGSRKYVRMNIVVDAVKLVTSSPYQGTVCIEQWRSDT